jgi:ssRNA-specific RNase YbeY (16S rRNA maturation enzyme)
MKIPESLKIGGFLIKIFYPTEQISFKNEKGEDALADGKLLISTGEIHIANKSTKENDIYTEDYIGEIFIHEILHAINYVYNSDSLPEDEIERLSQGLYQVLKDNHIKIE